MSNGDTHTSLLPAWARLVAYLGFPIAVATFFLAQNAGYIGTTKDLELRAMQQSLTSLNRQAETADIAMREHRVRQEDLIRTLATGLRVICENGARTAAERNNCANIQSAVRYTSP